MKHSMTNLRLTLLAAGSLVLAACGNNADDADTAATNTNEATTAATPAATTSPAATFEPIEMRMNEQMMAAMGATPEHTWAMKMVAHHQGADDGQGHGHEDRDERRGEHQAMPSARVTRRSMAPDSRSLRFSAVSAWISKRWPEMFMVSVPGVSVMALA